MRFLSGGLAIMVGILLVGGEANAETHRDTGWRATECFSGVEYRLVVSEGLGDRYNADIRFRNGFDGGDIRFSYEYFIDGNEGWGSTLTGAGGISPGEEHWVGQEVLDNKNATFSLQISDLTTEPDFEAGEYYQCGDSVRFGEPDRDTARQDRGGSDHHRPPSGRDDSQQDRTQAEQHDRQDTGHQPDQRREEAAQQGQQQDQQQREREQRQQQIDEREQRISQRADQQQEWEDSVGDYVGTAADADYETDAHLEEGSSALHIRFTAGAGLGLAPVYENVTESGGTDRSSTNRSSSAGLMATGKLTIRPYIGRYFGVGAAGYAGFGGLFWDTGDAHLAAGRLTADAYLGVGPVALAAQLGRHKRSGSTSTDMYMPLTNTSINGRGSFSYNLTRRAAGLRFASSDQYFEGHIMLGRDDIRSPTLSPPRGRNEAYLLIGKLGMMNAMTIRAELGRNYYVGGQAEHPPDADDLHGGTYFLFTVGYNFDYVSSYGD